MTIHRLQYISSSAIQIEQACIAGVRWVQLRVKNVSYEAYHDEALKAQAICKRYGATFIINDNVSLASTIQADGVHLGKDDMKISDARRILGNTYIIGGTANSIEDVRRVNDHGADYIGLGPFRFTTTKEKLSPVLGLDGYTSILETCRKESITLPVIAIGGIRPDDTLQIRKTGVYGVAVSSAISEAVNKEEVTKHFQQYLNHE